MKKLHTATTLLLHTFEDLLNGASLSELVIEGEATNEELNERWIDIYSQYLEVVGGTQAKAFLALIGRINSTQTKIIVVPSIVKMCLELNSMNAYSQPLLDRLKELGYTIPAEPQATCKKELELINTRLKREESNLKMLIAQRDAFAGEKEKKGRTSLAEAVAKISMSIDMQLQMNKLTISEYLGYYATAIERNKSKKAAARQSKRTA